MISFAASSFHFVAAGSDGSAQHVFVPGDLDLWPWHSNSSERGTKHVLNVNLAQIRSVVPEIFEAQTKKSQMALKTEPYLRAVMTCFGCPCICVFAYDIITASCHATQSALFNQPHFYRVTYDHKHGQYVWNCWNRVLEARWRFWNPISSVSALMACTDLDKMYNVRQLYHKNIY